MTLIFGDAELQSTLSNLSLTTVSVGAVLIGIVVLLALFFAPNSKSRTPLFAAMVTIVVAVTITVASTAIYTRGIYTPSTQTRDSQ